METTRSAYRGILIGYLSGCSKNMDPNLHWHVEIITAEIFERDKFTGKWFFKNLEK
jgi:hypothetical protein